MKRRTYIAAVGALTAGSSAILGTGAFETISTERQVSVDIVGDESGYLGIESTSDYASVDGTLSLDFSEANVTTGGGQGFNEWSETLFEDVFEVRNQGSRDDVEIQLDPEDGFLDAYFTETSSDGGYASMLVFPTEFPVAGPGEAIPYAVSVVVENDPGSFDESLTIVAETSNPGPDIDQPPEIAEATADAPDELLGIVDRADTSIANAHWTAD